MYEIDRELFGEFLAELRKEKGIKQKELAEKLYVSDKAVSKWETGHSIPDVSLLVPLAEILGVTVTELLECKRHTELERTEASHTDELVKTVIELSEEERSRKRKGDICIYLISVFIACAESYCFYRLSENWGFFIEPMLPIVALCILFGAYIWIFIQEKLPAYYDENKVSVYADGIFRMNMPGVYFNNNNWPYIVRALRIWSICGMVFFPLMYVLLAKIIGFETPGVLVAILLAIVLGGLFLPIYIVGKKYQESGNKTFREKRDSKKSVFVIVAVAILICLGMWGFLGSAGTITSGTKLMYVTSAGRDYWSASYQYFNGYTQRNLWISEDADGLELKVTSESGCMNIEIQDENGTVIFAQDNVQTGTYEVKTTGKIVVRINLEEHKGGFDIR